MARQECASRIQLWTIAVLAAALLPNWALSAAARGVSNSDTAPAIAVNDYEVDGVEVALLSVTRISDGSITVKWQYRNKTNEPKLLGEAFKGMGSSEAYSLIWDAYLTDIRNNTKYPVLKDTRGEPVGSAHAGRKVVTLKPKQTLNQWAKFRTPPKDTTKISVYIPGVQPFEEVSITDQK